MNRLVLGFLSFFYDMAEDRGGVLAGGGLHDQLGNLPRGDQLPVFGDRQRVAGQLPGVQAQLVRQSHRVGDVDRPALPVADRDLPTLEQQVQYGLGGVLSRVIKGGKAGRVDLVPAFLARPVPGDVLPQHFQPGGWHPLLTPFKHLINEADQDPGGTLGSQPHHRDLH